MAGTPPLPLDVTEVADKPTDADFWVRSLPRRFSPALREIVMGMLRADPKARPKVDDLSVIVDAKWASWRENTEEGKTVVLKGHQKIRVGAQKLRVGSEKRRIEARFPDLAKAGSLDKF